MGSPAASLQAAQYGSWFPLQARPAALSAISRARPGGVTGESVRANARGNGPRRGETNTNRKGGRAWNWLNIKNPAAPAVRREAEEDLGR